MKRKLCSLLLLLIFVLTNLTTVMAVEGGFNPYEANVVLTTCDEKTYADKANGWCGGTGNATFYDINFGDLGADSLEIGIGWSGTTTQPITISIFDDNSSTKETICTIPKGLTSTGWYTRTAYTYDLSRIVTGTHNLYISSVNGVNFYDIKFFNADPKIMNAPVYVEDFNDALDSSWATTKTAGSLSGVHSRTGTAYYMYGNGKNVVYSTGEDTNKVYVIWMYYTANSVENKQFTLSGTNSSEESKSVTISAHSAYSNFRVNTSTLSYAKSVGWHKFVVDCTSASATKVYIDGNLVKTLSETDSLASVSTVKLENGTDGSSVWFDDFKIYDTYSDVPTSKSEMIESVMFDSETAVDGATEITKYDGAVNISYLLTMQDVTVSNFALYKKEASANDNTYTLVENGVTLSEESTGKKSIIELPNLESTTKYRLYMNDLKCVNGSVMDNEFVEFSTGNVDARKGILYTEDFNDEVGEGWTATKFSLNSQKSHSMPASYYTTNSGSTLIYDTTEYPNSIFDIWFYYTKNTTEHKEIRLKGSDDSWISIVAHSTSSGYLLKNNGTITYTNVTRDEGWHRVIIDCVDANAVKFYVDNTLVGTIDAPFESVSTLQLENGVNNTSIWYDDLMIYDSMTYSPSFTEQVIKSVTFDNGTTVENAENVGKYDGNINIEYVSDMNDVSVDNFALYKKSAESTSDADYTLVTDGFTLENESAAKSVITVSNLEASTKYRLMFTGLTPVDGNVMADDFVEFTTSDNVNLLTKIAEDIRFENGIEVPTKGIPSEMCNDLTITFSEEINVDTLSDESVILEKITEDGTEAVSYTADVSNTAYILENIDLVESATYRLTLTTDILTANRNYLAENEVYEFSTSSDGIKQEPAALDDFETVSVSWTINPQFVENAHSGSNALLLNNGECATYTANIIKNGVYEVWFYDTMSSDASILLQLDGEDEQAVTFGIQEGISDKYWLTGDILVGSRSEGWHRFIVDFTNPSKAGYYIDDVLVAQREETFAKTTGISIISSSTTMLADDFKVWNLMDYQVISKVEENKAFICDENDNAVINYNEGDEVYIALEVNNQQEKQQNAMLLIGEYLNDVLQRVIQGSSDLIEPTESTVLKAEYTIPEDFENYELKAFCWEDILTMKSLMPASNPKEMTTVFLGSDDTYVADISAYLTEVYGDIEFVNSVVAGKGSDFGSKYFEAYVASNNPDILFVDYAEVDKSQAEVPVKKHMEQIVQKSLKLAEKPKIVFLNSSENTWHNEVAEYYNVPVLDLSVAEDYTDVIGNALVTEIIEKEEAFNLETVSVDTNIMSFNICVGGTDTNAWEYRKEAVMELLNNSDADVISMQEVSPCQYEYIKENINSKYDVFHYIREDSNTQAEGLAIAYNTEMFELAEKDRFWLSDTPDVPSLGWDAAYYRICVNGLLKHKQTGGLLDVYNVHLDHVGSNAQKNGLLQIVEKVSKKGYNSAVMGDFNFAPTVTDSYDAIANDMTDCMVNSRTTESGNTYHNFGQYTTGNPIDYIFVSNENMTPITFDIVTDQFTNSDGELKYYSDHYPVKTTVKITYEID